AGVRSDRTAPAQCTRGTRGGRGPGESTSAAGVGACLHRGPGISAQRSGRLSGARETRLATAFSLRCLREFLYTVVIQPKNLVPVYERRAPPRRCVSASVSSRVELKTPYWCS